MKKEASFKRTHTGPASKVGIEFAHYPAEEIMAPAPLEAVNTDDVMQDILNTVAEVLSAKTAPPTVSSSTAESSLPS